MPERDKNTKLRAFVAELRRRRVFRVAVLYAIAAFGILQVADIAFPALRLPDWSITIVVALTLLGFPVALVLAWAFDLTSRGVVRTESAAETDSSSDPPGRAAALAAVMIVISLTVATGWYVLPKLPGWWSAEVSAAGTTLGERTKLVVLPFVNLGSPLDKYFADGITEEITARLATIQGLGVIARTSAIQYKDTDKSIQQIGQELGVEYILEGTVRWANDPGGASRVRVTPQLIRVADATHLWADIYEKPLESVFEVQSEIAERVAEQLGVTLRERERLAIQAEPTQSSEAYVHFLLGKQLLESGAARASAEQAVELLEKAVELDEGYLDAQAKLAEAHANVYWANFRIAFGMGDQDYRPALARLYPGSFGNDSGAYYLARGILHDRLREPEPAAAYFDSARSVVERRLQTRPSDAWLHAQLGLALAGLGQDEAAVREGRRAVEMLPISEHSYAGSAFLDNLAHIYVMIEDYDAAVSQLRELSSAESPIPATWLKVDPTWDPLREDPDFRALLQSAR